MRKLIPYAAMVLISLIVCMYAIKKLESHQSKPQSTAHQPDEEIATSGFKEGDIVFQTSRSRQSKAIQLATHSPYSHCGLVLKSGNELLVFEAVQPVKKTPLKQWINRGDNGHYVIKRLKNVDQILTKAVLKKIHIQANSMLGKPYDLAFEWDDTQIYCSEFIWKVYQRATGIELGKPGKLKDFDLSHPAVKKIMKERYGNQLPLNEMVVSPAAILESDKLMTITIN